MKASIHLKSGLEYGACLFLLIAWSVLQGGCSDSPDPAASMSEDEVSTQLSDVERARSTEIEDDIAQLSMDFNPRREVAPELPAKIRKNKPVEPQPPQKPESTELPPEPARPIEEESATPEQTTVQPAPSSELTSVASAATVFEAMKLIDLRQLPRMTGAEASVDTPMQVSLTVKASVAEAKMFYTELLERAGWKLVPPAVAMGESKEYAQLNFSKAGFEVGVSLYRSPDTGLLSVGLNNYGNFDVRRLPLPEGSEPLHTSFNVAMYVTSSKVPQVAEACIAQLQADGWHWYTQPFTAYTENAQQRSLTFKKNGLGLSAFIALAPAQQNRTTVQYAVHMLGDELPIPANAAKITFLEAPLQLTFETAAEMLPTLEFFRKELAARGWQEKGAGNQTTSEAISVYQRSEGLPIVLRITRLTDEALTTVSIAEFEIPQDVPLESLTQVSTDQPQASTPEVQTEDFLPDGIAGLMTYEAWLEKNNIQPTPENLQQYAAEMEELANSLENEPAESK